MSASDLAAVVVTVCVIVTMTVLLFVLWRLVDVLARLREAADELADVARPAVSELRDTVTTAEAELERLHRLIDRAQQLSDNLSTATRFAARTVAGPAIKSRAVAAGAGRGVRRLFRGRRGER